MGYQDSTAHTVGTSPEMPKGSPENVQNDAKVQQQELMKENATSIVNELNSLKDAKTYPQAYKALLIADLQNQKLLNVAGINEVKPTDFDTIHAFVERLQRIVGAKDDGFYGQQTSDAVNKYIQTVDVTKSSVGGLSPRERVMVQQYLGDGEPVANIRVVKNENISLLTESLQAFTDELTQSDLPLMDQPNRPLQYLDDSYKSLLQPGKVVYLPPGTFAIMNYQTNKLMFATNKPNQDQLTTLKPQDLIVKDKFNADEMRSEAGNMAPTEKGDKPSAPQINIDELLANADHEVFEINPLQKKPLL